MFRQYGPGMHPASRLAIDAAPAVALAALAAVGLARSPGSYADPRSISAVLLVGSAIALVARRRYPAATILVAAGLVATYLLGLSEDRATQPPFEPFLVLVVGFFALGVHAERRSFVAGAAIAGGTLVAAEAAMLAAGRPLGEIVPSLLFWSAAAAVGRVVRRFQTSARTAETTAHDLAARRESDVREAVAAERARIARELHDVVAHSLSVMVVQASVEARLQPDSGVAATLRTIEETGRSAMDDLRRLLGLLRAEPGAPALSLEPMPTLGDLATTVERLRSGGHDVTLTVTGDVSDLPPGVGLSAYRIAQEALTNAVKHAPGSAVRLEVGYGVDGVRVTVENDGPHSPVPTGHAPLPGGHGLLGMRERVLLYSGTFEAGPRDGGGFGVRAMLPLRPEA